MEVISHGPLRVLGVPWQPRAGAHVLTIVAKATYDLRPVLSTLAEQQEDVNEADNHWDDDENRSLYAPSDAAPFKQRANVVVVGDAFAPHGEPVRSLKVRLVVGAVDKSIEVFGDRPVGSAGAQKDPAPFMKMPLVYERAAASAENPVGVRMVDAPGGRRAAAPNLTQAVVEGVATAAMGFGPIAPRWPSRARLLGRLGVTWSQDLLSRPLAEHFPAAFFNVAPQDQQIDEVSAEQHLVLENLSAEHPLLVTSLPGIVARAFAQRGGDIEEVHLTGDTLWIDTARQIATLVFRGQLGLAAAGERGRVVVVAEEPDRPLSWAEVGKICEAGGSTLPRLNDEPVLETAAVDARSLAQSARAAPAFLRRDAQPTGTPLTRVAAAQPRKVAKPGWSERDETMPVNLGRDPTGSVDGPHTATELPPGLADASPPWLAPGHAVEPPREGVGAGAAHVEPASVAMGPQAASYPRAPVHVVPSLVAAPAIVGLHTAALDAPSGPDSARPVAREGAPEKASPVSAPGLPPPPASLLAASNAAAAQRPAVPVAPASNPAAAAELRRHEPREKRAAPDLVELLWFDPATLESVRSAPRWKEIVRALTPTPRPVAYDDEAQPPEEPPAVKDKRDLFGILTLVGPDAPDALESLVEASAGERGAFTPPFAIVSGELSFPFDEIETLRATLTAVSPFAPSDKKLKELVETAHELLKTPWLSGSGAVVDGLLARVREQFSAQNRGLGAAQLDAQTERILLEQRHFQQRTVFGEPHLRALLTAGAAPPVVTYLTAELVKKLPMFQRMRVRLIAEVHLSQDQFETAPLALRTVVLARVVSPGTHKR